MEISTAIKYIKKKLGFKSHRLDILTILSGSSIEGFYIKIFKDNRLVFKRTYLDKVSDVKDLDLIIDDVKYRFSIYNSWID